MIRISQVKSNDPSKIEEALLKKLHMPKSDLISWSICRKSVDARKKQAVVSYIIDADVRNEKKYLKNRDVRIRPDERFTFKPEGFHELINRPVVVGFGPAGLFAALLLAKYGYRPLVLERGSEIDRRTKEVSEFWEKGILNPESNVQFGMGGAGAFSDGKLTTRSKDLKNRYIYEELVRLGANRDILIEKHPHIGTDGFVPILKNALKEIERLGGEVLFNTRLDDIETKDGKLCAVIAGGRKIPAQAMIFAAGHSAEDTILSLHEKGVVMEPKNFAIGVRIEHDQNYINQAMLKEDAGNPKLIPARYQLSFTSNEGRGVYSFCMCPGGYVIPSSSRPETVVVNGMSYSDRAGNNANAALLVSCSYDHLFDGLKAVRALEEKAYQVSGSYKAPVQLAKDFVEGKASDHFEEVKPTYALGTVFADFNEIFDLNTAKALKEGLLHFEHQVPGFLNQAVLTGVETRSSSTLKIVRIENMMASIQGIYPCGEGSGYSGGIMTSAVDGLKCAMALMNYYEKPEETGL